MAKSILKETEILKELLFSNEADIIDSTGRTKLIEKAQEISSLNPLSAEKKFEEEVVCSLVRSFNEFDQTLFSKLENYIQVSKLSNERIVEAFKTFVYTQEKNEDLILKACVARSTQNLLKSSFTYEYIFERFNRLIKLDPWLYIELIISCNWQKGVDLIEQQLKINYDTSYLFSILPEWISSENNSEKISTALSRWYSLFNEQDKKIAEYYANNYGYSLTIYSSDKVEEYSQEIETLLSGEGFSKFLHNPMKPNYKTIPTC